MGSLTKLGNMSRVTAPQEGHEQSLTPAVLLALLAVYIVWGSTYLAIRIGLEGFPPFMMGAVRFIIAGGGLYAYLRLRGHRNPTRSEWRGAAIVGGLLLVGGNGLVMVAEQWVASGLAALMVGTVPIWAALFGGFWRRWPNGREWIGLVVGFAGVALLNLEGDMRANPFGAATLLAATACWALGSVWSRHLTMPKGLMSSAAQMLTGSVGFTIMSLLSGEKIPAAMPGPRPLLAVLYLIVFGSIVAFSAYSYLLQHVRPSMATSYAYVNPMVAVALGVWLAGEQVTWIGLAAMAVILLGVAIVVTASSRRRIAPRQRAKS